MRGLLFVYTDILFQLGHEECLQIFKAETLTVILA